MSDTSRDNIRQLISKNVDVVKEKKNPTDVIIDQAPESGGLDVHTPQEFSDQLKLSLQSEFTQSNTLTIKLNKLERELMDDDVLESLAPMEKIALYDALTKRKHGHDKYILSLVKESNRSALIKSIMGLDLGIKVLSDDIPITIKRRNPAEEKRKKQINQAIFEISREKYDEYYDDDEFSD